MIQVTIQHKGKQITVICDAAKCMTKNSVSCYDYTAEMVTHYDGYIVEVRPA